MNLAIVIDHEGGLTHASSSWSATQKFYNETS